MKTVLSDTEIGPAVVGAFKTISEDYNIPISSRNARYIAYHLDEIGMSEQDVNNLFVRFTRTPEFKECVKYNRPPTAADLIAVFNRHSERPEVKL